MLTITTVVLEPRNDDDNGDDADDFGSSIVLNDSSIFVDDVGFEMSVLFSRNDNFLLFIENR